MGGVKLIKRFVTIIVSILIYGVCIAPTLCADGLNSIGDTLIVPDDYPTIQDAINNASIADTVFVRSGTYYENLQIHTNGIILQGENNLTTIIDGDLKSDVISIFADDLIISNLTLRNGLSKGIFLNDGNNCKIINNIIKSNNRFGIDTSNDDDQTYNDILISNNAMSSNGRAIGITNGYQINISNNIIFEDDYSSYSAVGLSKNVDCGRLTNFDVSTPFGITTNLSRLIFSWISLSLRESLTHIILLTFFS